MASHGRGAGHGHIHGGGGGGHGHGHGTDDNQPGKQQLQPKPGSRPRKGCILNEWEGD